MSRLGLKIKLCEPAFLILKFSVKNMFLLAELHTVCGTITLHKINYLKYYK